MPDPIVRDEPLPTQDLGRDFVGENDPTNPNRVFYPDTVHDMSPLEREAHRVVSVDSVLHRSDGSVFDTSTAGTHHSGVDRAMFVMTSTGTYTRPTSRSSVSPTTSLVVVRWRVRARSWFRMAGPC